MCLTWHEYHILKLFSFIICSCSHKYLRSVNINLMYLLLHLNSSNVPLIKMWECALYTIKYCKRCYFRAINFLRFAAQKHIRGLLNLRWADAHLSFLYCTKLTSFTEWYILQVYLTGQHKKQSRSRDRLEYITHLHQHTRSIHNSYMYVSRMCIQNIVNIFAGFWIRACWISVKFAKINVPRIFPLLQYALDNNHILNLTLIPSSQPWP